MYHRRKQQNLEERLSQMEQMRVLDMHAHLSCLEEDKKKQLSDKEKLVLGRRELELRRNHGVAAFFSCGTPEEWAAFEHLLTEDAGGKAYGGGVLRSFGIHPWYSAQYEPVQYYSLFAQCDAVGEIGMDSVWCNIPLQVQQERFVKQLKLAAKLKKPVILHTKGQEAQIAELVGDFPGKICVHWYSGDEKSFEKFLELGCYFTLGPDVSLRCGQAKLPGEDTVIEGHTRKLYQRMIHEIPSDRLFLETDGISAVAWAQNIPTESCAPDTIAEVLEENLQFAAQKKGMHAEELRQQMWKNLRTFLK